MKRVAFALLLVAGCSGVPAPNDGGTPQSPSPSSHPPFPVVSSHGGAVLTSMQVWTVVWSGDTGVGALVDSMHQAMFADSYWATVTSEYGVGPANARGVIQLPDAAPATLDVAALEQLVPHAATVGNVTISDETAFAFVAPAATMVTAGTMIGCTDFAGLHDETSKGVPFQLLLQCNNAPLGVVVSHEAIECATNPRPETAPAWFSDQIRFGEVADLCEGLSTDIASGNTQILVTRAWSARAASTESQDPCLPAPAGPFFNTQVAPLVVSVGRGGTATAMLIPFAFADVGTIRWRVVAPPGVTFTPDTGVNSAGDLVSLTVAASTGIPAADLPFRVDCASNSGGVNAWNGQVTVE